VVVVAIMVAAVDELVANGAMGGGNEVTGLYNKVLHQSSIQNERARSEAKDPQRGLVEGLWRKENIP
jgi:hypothetical protein